MCSAMQFLKQSKFIAYFLFLGCASSSASMLELYKDDVLVSETTLFTKNCVKYKDADESPETYRQIATCEARKLRLPPAVAHAVMEIESNFSPSASGDAGEIGLMQIMPGTARLLGFSGTLEELRVPETNIRLGVRYLAEAYLLAGGDVCTTVMKYRAGHGETRFSHLSVNYCLRARAILAREGYVVSGTVPVATFGYASPLGLIGRSTGTKQNNGVCVRRSFVPGPRYRTCISYRDRGDAKRIQILRSRLFTQ